MKKLFSKVLLSITILGVSGLGVLAKDYKDLPKDHWAYKQIQTLTEQNVVVGYPDGNYRPEANVTRAEFATMVIKALNQQNAELTSTYTFKDFNEKHWAWGNVERAVMFDLLKGNPDGTFNPDGNVSRGHAISVAVSALTTEKVSNERAVEILEDKYVDYKDLPAWLIVASGKAEVLGLIVTPPGQDNVIAAERPATRAELAAFLVKMAEAAKLNPNEKLRAVMMPKLADGIVVPNTTLQDNFIATIPAGTIIPVVVLNDKLSTQSSKVNDRFDAKLPRNLITKERYLLIVENSPITGHVASVKVAKCFFRDGKMQIVTTNICTDKNPNARFEGVVLEMRDLRPFWKTFFKRLFRGSVIEYHNGQVVNVQLTRPIRIDLIHGMIIE